MQSVVLKYLGVFAAVINRHKQLIRTADPNGRILYGHLIIKNERNDTYRTDRIGIQPVQRRMLSDLLLDDKAGSGSFKEPAYIIIRALRGFYHNDPLPGVSIGRWFYKQCPLMLPAPVDHILYRDDVSFFIAI